MALNLPDNPGMCDAIAQIFGALAYVDGICVPVSGMEILILDDRDSIQESNERTNYNFHCSGVKPPVPTRQHLPGPVATPKKGEFA